MAANLGQPPKIPNTAIFFASFCVLLHVAKMPYPSRNQDVVFAGASQAAWGAHRMLSRVSWPSLNLPRGPGTMVLPLRQGRK